jgi:hypothetical protein
MRKIVLSLSLCVLLLTGQLGAWVHELSHLNPVAHQDVHLDKSPATEAACALCLAYSQVANPAGHTPQIVRFDPTSCAARSTRCPANIPSEVPTARSRGPPVQLSS